MKEEASVNQLKSQDGFDRCNQFVNFLLVAAILRNTLADQVSSVQPGVEEAYSTEDSSKGQVLEGSGLEQNPPESLSRGGKVEEGSTDDKGCKREPRESPAWVRFEPWLGSWIEITEGDQFIATNNFNFGEFTIYRGDVGSVVKIYPETVQVPYINKPIRITKSVTLEFLEERVRSGLGFSDLVEDRDATQPVPVWMSPFLLLPEKAKFCFSNIKWEGSNPVEKLRRDGRHPFGAQ